MMPRQYRSIFRSNLKNDACLEKLEFLEVEIDSSVIEDVIVRVGSHQKKMKHNLRMIQTEDSQGNPLFNRTVFYQI
jgi:hypothetical protein